MGRSSRQMDDFKRVTKQARCREMAGLSCDCLSPFNPRIGKEIADGFIVIDAADGFGENGRDG